MALGDTNTVAAAAGPGSVAIGHNSKVNGGTGAVAIGEGQVVSGNGAVAIGDPNTVTGTGAVGMGANNTVNGTGAVGLGSGNTATGQGSVALGNASSATAAGSLAFGDGASAVNAKDVALGSGSVTAAAVGTKSTVIGGTTYNFAGGTPASTVSVGAAGAERTITNVAAGRIALDSTDAINGSQLFATNKALEANIAGAAVHYYSVNDGGTKGANYGNNGATGTSSLAAGVAASATAANATAVGSFANASGQYAFAAGDQANAGGSGGVAIEAFSQCERRQRHRAGLRKRCLGCQCNGPR